MEKIATPADLSAELRTLLAYTTEQGPSREKLAQHLRGLADRVAARGNTRDLTSTAKRGVIQLRMYLSGEVMDRQDANNYQAEKEAQKVLDAANEAEASLDRVITLLDQYQRKFAI